MYISSEHKIRTTNPELFGDSLNDMPQWQLIVCDRRATLIYQSNFIELDWDKINEFSGLTGAFMLRTSMLIDAYLDFDEKKFREIHKGTRGSLSPLVSITDWPIDKSDKETFESSTRFMKTHLAKLDLNELIGELVDYYKNKEIANASSNNK